METIELTSFPIFLSTLVSYIVPPHPFPIRVSTLVSCLPFPMAPPGDPTSTALSRVSVDTLAYIIVRFYRPKRVLMSCIHCYSLKVSFAAF